MCVLTRGEIENEMAKGRLRVDPFDPSQIGPASIDLHLGDEIRVPHVGNGDPIHVTDEADPQMHTDLVRIDEPYVLNPGHTIHGVTVETVYLPPDLCAWIEGRSRIARFGLTVHVTSGFVHPGVENKQVLEMTNVSTTPLAIHAGIRVCQIVLERTEGQAVYRGRFADQATP
jgi:dCTP deaminase